MIWQNRSCLDSSLISNQKHMTDVVIPLYTFSISGAEEHAGQ